MSKSEKLSIEKSVPGRRGVRFANAFVQSGVCGPSRMSFYTGRYVSSHGATWNRVPLGLGERTLGEYVRAGGTGHDLWLAGKTHVLPDDDGLARLAIEAEGELGHLLRSGGFREIDRHDPQAWFGKLILPVRRQITDCEVYEYVEVMP